MSGGVELADAFADVARRHPERVAIVEEHAKGPVEIRFDALAARIGRLRGQLVALGFAPGQILPLACERTADAVALAFAALTEGGAVCWLTPKLRGPQLTHVVAMTAPIGLIVDAAGAEGLTSATDEELRILRPIALGGSEGDGLRALAGRIRLSKLDARSDGDALEIRSAEARADGAAVILFTSGSTGTPKGVRISGTDLVKRATTEIACFDLSPADRLLGLLPFSFDVGQNQLHAALLAGATLHLSTGWLLGDLRAVVERAKVTGISAVPSLWGMAMASARPDARLLGDTPLLRYVTVSGGSLPPTSFARLSGNLAPHVAIHRTYGQSETFRSTIFLNANAAEHSHRLASVGSAVPDAQIHIARDRTTLAARGEEGEVIHHGAGTMLGYLGDDDLTRSKLGRHACLGEEIVVYTGDRGRIDEDGHLYLCGRGDAMIKTMGFRVYPAEVEEVLARHPDVAEVVVFGIPDGMLEAKIIAVVVGRSANADGGDLRAFAGERLPGYMVPRVIEVWPALPKTANGKPALMDIRARFLV